ncbi:MAG: F0F1 ATP synthase subunit gamma [Planctomycetota bacterium]
MANLKELRGRIKSIASIAQITRAMEMVASMKLRKVQARAQSFHPYAEEMLRMIERLARRVEGELELPLFERREIETTGILLITSDRGLCGSYNSNLLFELRSHIERASQQHPGRKIRFYCIGRKGYTWLVRRGFPVERYFADPPLDKIDFAGARLVADALAEAFLERKVDEVRLFHSRFRSMIKFEPVDDQFLPVPAIEREPGERRDYELDFLLEPDARTLFEHLLPSYLEVTVFDAMLQALASEQASRRMAMKSATDAAVRMNKDLKKVYNRARQEAITKELLDIVGGANAVG